MQRSRYAALHECVKTSPFVQQPTCAYECCAWGNSSTATNSNETYVTYVTVAGHDFYAFTIVAYQSLLAEPASG